MEYLVLSHDVVDLWSCDEKQRCVVLHGACEAGSMDVVQHLRTYMRVFGERDLGALIGRIYWGWVVAVMVSCEQLLVLGFHLMAGNSCHSLGLWRLNKSVVMLLIHVEIQELGEEGVGLGVFNRLQHGAYTTHCNNIVAWCRQERFM